MMWFHLRQFMSVPYFLQIMVVTTVVSAMTQFVAYQAWGSVDPARGWVRAGVIGLWTTATFSAGIVGFERYKGTLVYLVLAPIGSLRCVAAVVSAAASFGLLAFPLAWATWAALAGSMHFAPVDVPRLLGGVVLLWLGAVAISFVVAAVFILTPNAIAYEELLLVPVFFTSGVLFTSAAPPGWLAAIGRLLPLSTPIDVLFGRAVPAMDLTVWLVVLLAWLGLARMLGRHALVHATKAGTVEVI
ncbi:MAG: hypothetical protein Q4A82_00605 [Corynebacterium sp.]|nr:hypothetical protein [Corynebacterium sp.]